MTTNNNPSTSNQSLARALNILDLYSNKDFSWGIREIARELNSNPATIYRSVKTMQDAGFLEKDSNTNRYSLSPKFLMLADVFSKHNPIQIVAQKIFNAYSQKFPHNFYLGKLFNEQIMYITVLEGKGPIKVSVTQGVSIELYCSALGKALLAYQEDDYIHEYLSKTDFKAYTEDTVTDPRELWEEIQAIREKGYAQNVGERYDGIGAIGVPLNQKDHEVDMAVCLAYPQHMIQNDILRMDDLIQMVKEISYEISTRLAYPGLNSSIAIYESEGS